MSSDGTALRHHALVYESTDEYLACAVPFLKAGIEAGEGAIVAHTKPGLAMMREALGPDAPRGPFVDVTGADTRAAYRPAADPVRPRRRGAPRAARSRTRRRQDRRSAITRSAACCHRGCEQRYATRRRHPRGPCRTRPGTIRLRDRRPR